MAKKPEPLPADAVFVTPGEVRPLFCTRAGLKTLFGIESSTASNWASMKIGPKYYRVGKLAFYSVEEVSNFITQNAVETGGNL